MEDLWANPQKLGLQEPERLRDGSPIGNGVSAGAPEIIMGQRAPEMAPVMKIRILLQQKYGVGDVVVGETAPVREERTEDRAEPPESLKSALPNAFF